MGTNFDFKLESQKPKIEKEKENDLQADNRKDNKAERQTNQRERDAGRPGRESSGKDIVPKVSGSNVNFEFSEDK